MPRKVLLLLLGCVLVASASAQTGALAPYAGKVLIQRQFVSGAHPVYDAEGKVLSGDIGPWTTSAKVEVKDIRVDGERLLIEGRRLLLLYDLSTKQFRDVFDIMASPDAKRLIPVLPEGKQLDDLRAQQPVTIEVRRAGGWDDATVAAAMKGVFLVPEENLSDVAPEFWKDWLCRMETEAGRMVPCMGPPGLGPAGPAYKVGGGVTAPRALAVPDPQYSEMARKAKYQGTCILWVVVGREGRVQRLRLARPVGLGLDEKAAEAVSRWYFDPATKDGQPVNVQINVEVNFRLY